MTRRHRRGNEKSRRDGNRRPPPRRGIAFDQVGLLGNADLAALLEHEPTSAILKEAARRIRAQDICSFCGTALLADLPCCDRCDPEETR